VRGLGDQPAEPREHERWLHSVSTVAAYRDRYEVASDRPVSGGAASDVQRPDRARARSALRDAAAVATGRRWPQRPRRAAIQATLPP
jgi:hypothetical protein